MDLLIVIILQLIITVFIIYTGIITTNTNFNNNQINIYNY